LLHSQSALVRNDRTLRTSNKDTGGTTADTDELAVGGQNQTVVLEGFVVGGGDFDDEGPVAGIEADEMSGNHPGPEYGTGYQVFQGVQELVPGLQGGF
jgi:hypothetical protein